MIPSILKYFGISQNAERIKAELKREVNGQVAYVSGASRVVLQAGIIYAVAAILGIITSVVATFLLYVWLTLYLGSLGALAVLSAIFAIMTLTAVVVAQSKIAKLPVYHPISLPDFYRPVERPVPHPHSPLSPVKKAATSDNTWRDRENLNGAEADTAQWVMGLFREGYSQQLNTGVPALDSFIETLQPDAEAMARRGLDSLGEQLRVGSRPTLATILLGGLVTGFLLSSRGAVRRRGSL